MTLGDGLHEALPYTPTTPINVQTQPTVVVDTMANPTPYSGLVEEFKRVLLQCSLIFEMQPNRFSTDQRNFAFILSLLTRKGIAMG